MDLSIIVCTKNRRGASKPCLDSTAMSMSSVSGMSKEIIVVDNGSQDRTRDLLRSWAGLRERVPHGSHLSEALHRYARGLERARTFMRLVAATKDHKWSEAAGILRRPEMWALVRRFGCEAISKRADRLRKRQLPELTTEHAQ